MLPGDKTPRDIIHAMIRVNQAGEYGAARIYEGQLSVLKDTPLGSTLQHMRDQEQHHLDTFDHLIRQHQVRPTVLTPVWHVGGYILGKVTAHLGEKAALACTVAVEEVIDEHYEHQIQCLKDYPEEQELLTTLKQFQEDERQHKNISLDAGAADAPAFRVMKTLIQGISRSAIWLSTRF